MDIMDVESDGDEFFDAAEYPTISTLEKEDDSRQTASDECDGSPIIGCSSVVSCTELCQVQIDDTNLAILDEQRYVGNRTIEALQPSSLHDEQQQEHEVQYESLTDSYQSPEKKDKKTTEVKTKELVQEIDRNNSDKTNNLNQAPVAPPRRKKKNKKQPDKDQNSSNNENFKSYVSSDKIETGDDKDVKTEDNPVSNTVEDRNTEDENVKDLVVVEEVVDSDLDISTQEMSEILDRNSCTEVISPLHLQRNKSQSISSIGSFCSVSSNISFQEKSKESRRSGSQVSLGSLNNTEKTPTSTVGLQLTDQEILEQVVVRNLDTGECMPLSDAEKNLPSGVNPLALHIMRLTTEFSSKQDLASSDREDAGDSNINVTTRKILRKKKNLRGLFVRKVKNKDQKLKGSKEGGKRTEESSSSDEENPHAESYIKVKSANGKGVPIINKLNIIQDFSGKHQGAVWTMKFSSCGKLLGTAGQDKVVHVWVLKTGKDFFEQMRSKYAKADTERPPTPETEKTSSETCEEESKSKDGETDYHEGFCKEPFCTYEGHTGDVLDLSWSKNYFLLSSSMDKTVRLWHISRSECLCCFQHIDFVTAITFHPRDDRYFLSGSLDGKIRLWNIPDKKVALWNELEGAGSHLITAANFCMNGKFAVIGTYDGRCIFYETEHLKYYTQWQIRSTRKKQGRKISGIEPMPGEEKILITSSDSRIRLYSLKDHSLHCKYKGFTNSSSQIKGSFSHDGELVVSGSEDHYVYMWRAQHRIASARKDRNDFYESFSAHNAVVTAAIFAPCPWNVVPTEYDDNSTASTGPEVIVAADWTGAIKIFINRYSSEKT